MMPRWVWWAGGAVLALLVAWLIVATLRPDPIPPEILPPRVDSALVAERTRAAVLDSVVRATRARDDSIRAEQSRRDREDAARRRSIAALSAHADTLAALARAKGDTASAAWAAYLAEREASDSLRRSLVAADSARAADSLRIHYLAAAHDSVNAQRRALLALTADLREAVDRAARRNECRIIGPIKCPSRTTVAVVGVVGGYVAAEYLNREGP